ncbi:Plasma membrane fusion protein prm1 [Labeo rohita]|uniref:Plasma membrane fusion protein prm1 n=1 Tax=Labeo rohita TaxID=84645 RepID=A0ABQ8LVH3_LABRO|nr:Plasma membrane fusion protein prm1 [Labeo rohita]
MSIQFRLRQDMNMMANTARELIKTQGKELCTEERGSLVWFDRIHPAFENQSTPTSVDNGNESQNSIEWDGGGLRRRTKEWMWDGEKGWQEIRLTVLVEVQAEDGDLGRGRQRESRVDKRRFGGSDRRRSLGEDRRDLEQEEPGRTQAAAMMATHSGANRGRSHGGGRADDFRGPTDSGRAGWRADKPG